MTPIERAAQALLDADLVLNSPYAAEQAARAVLKAIRAPSDGMVRSVDGSSYGQPQAVYLIEDTGVEPGPLMMEVWFAMIDAALKEGA